MYDSYRAPSWRQRSSTEEAAGGTAAEDPDDDPGLLSRDTRDRSSFGTGFEPPTRPGTLHSIGLSGAESDDASEHNSAAAIGEWLDAISERERGQAEGGDHGAPLTLMGTKHSTLRGKYARIVRVWHELSAIDTVNPERQRVTNRWPLQEARAWVDDANLWLALPGAVWPPRLRTWLHVRMPTVEAAKGVAAQIFKGQRKGGGGELQPSGSTGPVGRQ